MAFKRSQQKKAMTLPSFIDIIFLLLVFFVATINISTVVSDRNQGNNTQVQFDLPETRSKNTGPVHEILRTLLVEIDHENRDDPKGPLRVLVLWPNARDSLNLGKARDLAIRQNRIAFIMTDSLKSRYPDRTDRCPYELIEDEINRYAESALKSADPKNFIEIRAVKETQFRVVNHILQICARVEGDRIPQIQIRTMTGDPESYGL